MKKTRSTYHHGNLAESMLDAVDEIATAFGLEAVTLRACAKRVGVSPSSAFRHFSDKRALMTAFATRALIQLERRMADAEKKAGNAGEDAFLAVGLAYIGFALDKPAFFRAMWREETLYSNDEAYRQAAESLSTHLTDGFARSIDDDDPDQLGTRELLAWSSVHGLASLLVDGPVERDANATERLTRARAMLCALTPALAVTSER